MRDKWNSRPLIDLADYINGYAFKPSQWENEGVPIVRIEQINGKPTKDYCQERIPLNNQIDNGDLIFSWSATLKAVVWRGGNAYLNQHLFKVIPKRDIDKYYLLHLLDYYMEALGGQSQGSTMKHVKRSELKTFFVDIPEYSLQRKIAKILNTADAVIEKTEKAIAKYSALKQGMMQDLFTRGIDLQTGQLRPAYEDAPHLYKETELGWIPKEWDYNPLKDLTKLITDGAHFSPVPQSEGLPIGNVKDMTPYGFDLGKCTKIKTEMFKQLERQNCAPQIGDVLLSKDGTIGKVIYFNSSIPIVLLSSIAIIRPNLVIEGSYLSYVLQSAYFDKELFKLVSGSALKRITLKDIQKIRMPFPSNKKEQITIATKINKIDSLIKKEQANLAKHQSLKKGLMQDLLTGRVEVEV